VFSQGHPEYDTISLLKEYKREVILYTQGKRKDYPTFPKSYFRLQEKTLLNEYRKQLDIALTAGTPAPEFPESLIIARLDNTWHDTAEGVIANWMGLVYQVTHNDRRKPFMDEVNPDDPLNLYS
jgi:homoserine O-succinyltransferase